MAERWLVTQLDFAKGSTKIDKLSKIPDKISHIILTHVDTFCWFLISNYIFCVYLQLWIPVRQLYRELINAVFDVSYFSFSYRIRMNCVGIFDILSFDASQANPLSMMPHYQVGFFSKKDCRVKFSKPDQFLQLCYLWNSTKKSLNSIRKIIFPINWTWIWLVIL